MKKVFRLLDDATNEFVVIDGTPLEATNLGLLLEKSTELDSGVYIPVEVWIKE